MNAWLESGLSNALVATLVAVAAWAATRWYRHPRVAFVLWLLVLVRLLMPPLVGVAWPQCVWPQWPRDALAVAAVDVAAPLDVTIPAPAADVASPHDVAAAARDARPRAAAAPSWRWPSWQTLVCAVWLAGSAVWIAVALVRIARFRRTLARAPLAPAALQAEAGALAEAMGVRRCPLVRLVNTPVPPLVWALARRPSIVLPAALAARLSPAELTTLVAHELAHVARRDHLVRLLEMAALAAFWWHPVAWWARRQVARAGEEICDAAVVARFPELARSYAAALLATVEFLADARPALPAGTSGISQVRQLRRRLEMILRGTVRNRVNWPLRLALVALAVVVLAPFFHAAAAQKPFVPKPGTIDERLDRLEKAMQELTEALRALRATEQENAPPMVVKTVPENGAKDVDPSLTEIRVTFSKDMHDGTWSWTQRSDDTFPEVTGKPHYVDKRTCVLPVKLEPGKTYYLSINSERFRNFKDEGRRGAIPYPITFTTASK